MKNLFLWLPLALLISACSATGHRPLDIKSPGGKVSIRFHLDTEGKPFYQSWFNDDLVIDTSYLGFLLHKTAGLEGDFEVIGDVRTTFDETWEQPWGEQHFIRNHYNELKVSLQEKQALKRKLDIVFRVYDDGFGFRCEFPEQENLKLEINSNSGGCVDFATKLKRAAVINDLKNGSLAKRFRFRFR